MLEGDPVQHGAAREVDEEAAAVLIDGEEEGAIGGGGKAGYVGGALDGESDALRFEEVGVGDSVADGGDQVGVLGDDGVAASVGSSEEVLEPVVHVGSARK